MKKILYVGWIGFNNLGDELMWHVFRDLAEKHLDPAQAEVIPSLPKIDLKNLNPYDTVVLGGGSLLIPGYVDVVHKAVQLKKNVVIWGSGYDSLEPVTLDENGAFSLPPVQPNERMRHMLDEIGEHASFFGIRGPLTYQYLQQLGVRAKPIISGDPGMLLLPQTPVEAIDLAGKSIIGINWGTSYNRIYGKNEAVVEEALTEAAKALIKDGHHIYLFAMWGPDREAIKRLYKKIAAPDHTTLDLTLHNHVELMKRISGFQATINFKLHANVISAAAGVPFVCLAYRFKCLDFACSLGAPETIVSTDHAQLQQEILTRTQEVLQNRDTLAAKIKAQQKAIMQELEQPFLQQLL
ncbi:polysaccharide pyruvyl transferase family protein [Brevibacillus migulae]|uniref:polysaccharide pyruvyl transferase family protein n=1 Tax=Brevibacillus migulae TaxID=1644114 RepID=UPI001F43A14D|nr:polysaccharide pyruvyl transferase family protein [Brevibacillus migulae]